MAFGLPDTFEIGEATRDAFGKTLRDLGHDMPDIVVVDGDVSNSTRTEFFAKEFEDRFFNLGIAESNLVSTASGFAESGKQAVAASFACFLLNNAYEQIRMSVAFPNVNVKLVGSHAGISIGEDGPSQMAIEDIALANSFPNFTVLVPADSAATAAATRAMFSHAGPTYLRTGRVLAPVVYQDILEDFQIGKSIQIRDGKDVTIIACGLMVAIALEAANTLSKSGIEARVIDMHTIKPIDEDAIEKACQETGAIVTAEEHLLNGGLGSIVARVVTERHPVPMAFVGIHDTYAESGDPDLLFQKYGLTPENIRQAVMQVLKSRHPLG
jgi:transketolase